jgi:hypothetical protein
VLRERRRADLLKELKELDRGEAAEFVSERVIRSESSTPPKAVFSLDMTLASLVFAFSAMVRNGVVAFFSALRGLFAAAGQLTFRRALFLLQLLVAVGVLYLPASANVPLVGFAEASSPSPACFGVAHGGGPASALVADGREFDPMWLSQSCWVVDSRASVHICCDRSLFTSIADIDPCTSTVFLLREGGRLLSRLLRLVGCAACG